MSLTTASPAPSSAGCQRDADPSSVGMMEGAFFVSRTELLDWVNSTLGLSLSRVEQCASGCVYLQALDCLFGPRSRVAMSKVKWAARHEYEFVQNYKLLQAAFDAHDVHKHIEVSRLVKAKYQDNLEFLQWLKAFCDRQASVYATDVPYDPIERRRVRLLSPMQAKRGPHGRCVFMPWVLGVRVIHHRCFGAVSLCVRAFGQFLPIFVRIFCVSVWRETGEKRGRKSGGSTEGGRGEYGAEIEGGSGKNGWEEGER
ncbi:microtubule-associated protein [Cyclospora cayetanensis]|uniref:Microtubule-associated protein n=1 Tax=Cyclospora cayetanensis TaxID=88456 RepID=A0A1D3CZ66_9EIME|nr:microtubule-associated protein [Cyclospora cayetanensis]